MGHGGVQEVVVTGEALAVASPADPNSESELLDFPRPAPGRTSRTTPGKLAMSPSQM